jgi:hypothetical protein
MDIESYEKIVNLRRIMFMSELYNKIALRFTTLTTAVMLACAVWFPVAVAAAEDIADVTVLVYMNGSDLESADDAGAASKDLDEMMAVGSTDKVNVVVETGGTQKWMNSNISAERNQRWLVQQGELELVNDDLGSRSIGDAATLQDFITWGVANYPAKKYALIFWNHGAGSVHGFGSDELFEGDSLLLPEIDTALHDAYKETEVTFELIGFDACLMATVETASMVKSYAKYLVASEELEPGHGWDYTPILKHLVEQSDLNGPAVGKAIVDGYKLQAEEQETANEITLSVVDLAKLPAVEEAFDSLIELAAADLAEPQRILALSKARSKAEDYGSSGAHGGNTDMVDLVDLAEKASALYPDEAAQLVDSIKEAVVYNINSVSKPNAAGLSIYFPYKDKENFQDNLDIYKTLSFSETYRSFVEAYVSKLGEDTQAIRFENEVPQVVESEDTESEGTLYQVSITNEDMEQLSEAYSVLTTYADSSESTLLFLGMDDTVTLNEETGVLEDTFTGQSVTLNGNFVSMFLTGYGEDYTEYGIPAKLNGKEVDILVNYNYENGESRIIGAWAGIDEKTGMADKDIIKIKSGDVITPVFYTYDEITEKDGFLEGDSFTVGGALTLEQTPLPEGRYLFGFYLIDYAQNESYSDFIEVELTAEEAAGDGTEESADPNAIQVTINGELQQYEQPPVLVGDYTMVPLRAIFQALGATIEWDGETSTVTAVKDETVVVLQIGNNLAEVNGEEIKLDQAAVLVNENTMVPVRFVSEALGAHVDWDQDTRTVIIQSH